MNAKQAQELSIKSKIKILTQEYEIKKVLETIKNSAENGKMECNYYYDPNIRESLILMGYDVSDMWVEQRWYKTEYMTISWDKK